MSDFQPDKKSEESVGERLYQGADYIGQGIIKIFIAGVVFVCVLIFICFMGCVIGHYFPSAFSGSSPTPVTSNYRPLPYGGFPQYYPQNQNYYPQNRR